MTDVATKLMAADEFLVWSLGREGRWELISGVPVLVMMGATRRHDLIVVNLIAALRQRLRGGPCRPMTADIASRMMNGNVRRPDVTVDCGPRNDDALDSGEPAVFFEVLSPSTRREALIRKPEEYKQVPSLQCYAVLEPRLAYVILWSRRPDGGWEDSEVSGLDASLDLPGIGVNLPMSEIYDGVAVEV